MPHLAPLAWALTPLLFWLLLLSTSASLWWSTTPSFPMCVKSSHQHAFSPWNWA
uniref:ATP synthase F0 subunit 8 n=1 Tax=Prionospio sp. 7 MH-2023 TaxID=3059275 RepID=A0AAU6QGA4_9ANNE